MTLGDRQELDTARGPSGPVLCLAELNPKLLQPFPQDRLG